MPVQTEDLSGYAFATEPDFLEFPRDLGAHEDYQTEWWYYTGNLTSAEGRTFGYQFTIFRRSLTPEFEAAEGTDWRTNQIYFAHAAIADVDSNRFLFGDIAARGIDGLAGAQSEPYEVFIENWTVREISPGVHEMTAEKDGVGFKFTLEETRVPAVHGLGGLSAKGPNAGEATYYYSLVDIKTTGELWIGEERHQVEGVSWKDHEFGTDFLPDDAVGWDWFSAQFGNGEALLFAEIRLDSGEVGSVAGGYYITAEQQSEQITEDEIELEVLDTWRSPTTDAVYPSEWIVRIPSRGIEFQVETLIDNAELVAGIGAIYWEGPVRYTGTLNGEPIVAYGYVEMTGYVNPIDL